MSRNSITCLVLVRGFKSYSITSNNWKTGVNVIALVNRF